MQVLDYSPIPTWPDQAVSPPWLLAGHNTPDPDPPIGRAPDMGGAEHKHHVLLVEDNYADVLMVEEAIAAYGLPIELHTVDDGEKAFDYIQNIENDPRSVCPVLVILDLNLPRRSGLEVLERVRQSGKWKDVPVLIMTSSSQTHERAAIDRLGANGYFHKSPDYDEFLRIGAVVKAVLPAAGTQQ